MEMCIKMGRGVSCPSNYHHRVFFEHDEEAEEWYFLLEDIKEFFKSFYDSLYDSDKWIGREDHVILENSHCQIGISGYCGLCCLWVVIKETDFQDLSNTWVDKYLCPFMTKHYAKLKREGTMSNGVSIYSKVIK